MTLKTKFVLMAFLLTLTACAPVAIDRRDSNTPLIANTDEKIIKPFSRWELIFDYKEKKQIFLMKMPGVFYLNSINPQKNTQRASGEFTTQGGIRGQSLEDEGEGFIQLLIFENPDVIVEPVVSYGKFLHHNWDIKNEKVFECYFFYKSDSSRGLLFGSSHYGLYESRYGRELQKDGCVLRPTT
jgi:hypothetical protein